VAAMRTPPYKLLATRAAGAELECLVQGIHAADSEIPGIGTDKTTVKAFSERWCDITGKSAQTGKQMRIHELTQVNPPKWPSGAIRLAMAADLELLYSWMRGFADDTGITHVRRPEDWVPAAVESQQVYLWDDNGPVSMAIWGHVTNNGVSIRGVYTPHDQCNRGYASAIVASVSQIWLGRGKRFACLFTDLANPTSNHIYYELGFRPVVEVDDYLFD
jgi:predicted GNAT family acetyltransferase